MSETKINEIEELTKHITKAGMFYTGLHGQRMKAAGITASSVASAYLGATLTLLEQGLLPKENLLKVLDAFKTYVESIPPHAGGAAESRK